MKIEELTAAQRAQQARLESQARDIAELLDGALNPCGLEHREHGFALLLFGFGDPNQPATWISNGDRQDMIHAVEEWLARAKGRT